MGMGILTGTGGAYAIGGGAIGILLGALYLGSPAWRITVVTDDTGLAVRASGDLRFRLAWDEITSVLASADTRTCFVNGGSPEHSLLVPGPGASAPYAIERRHELYDQICSRVPPERIRHVPLLEAAAPGLPQGAEGGLEEGRDATHDKTESDEKSSP